MFKINFMLLLSVHAITISCTFERSEYYYRDHHKLQHDYGVSMKYVDNVQEAIDLSVHARYIFIARNVEQGNPQPLIMS